MTGWLLFVAFTACTAGDPAPEVRHPPGGRDTSDRPSDTGNPADTEEPDDTADPDTPPPDGLDLDAPLTLYLAVDGDDDAAGTAPEAPLRTLDAVHARLLAWGPRDTVDVLVAPGTYHCREMEDSWTFRNGHRIRLAAAVDVPGPARDEADHPDRPVFEGRDEADENCDGSVFLTLRHAGEPLVFTLEDVAITRYRGALSVKAEDGADPDVDQDLVVRNVVMERIGDKYHYVEHADGSWLEGKGAILLTDTSGGRFEENYFHHVRNVEGSEGLIHAMYFTAHASRHRVEDNVFHGCTGAIVKLSDFSNGNVFVDNAFSSGQLAVRDRWCGALEDPETCTDGVAQCPSWENEVPYERNTFSDIEGDEPVKVLDIPDGQTCDHDPPASNIRMDLGTGGVIEGP